MSMYEDVTMAIHREIDSHGSAVLLSPTFIAVAVQRKYTDAPIEPHLQYTSLEQLKQMARKALARQYDPECDENNTYQGELFNHLQDRYPVPVQKDEERVYKLREALSLDEVEWNIKLLRKSAHARLLHADALQAWVDTFPKFRRTRKPQRQAA